MMKAVACVVLVIACFVAMATAQGALSAMTGGSGAAGMMGGGGGMRGLMTMAAFQNNERFRDMYMCAMARIPMFFCLQGFGM